jgi:hypothetical protein
LLLTASRIDELEKLIRGTSVVVSDTSRSLADRDLLSDSRCVVRRTPEQLIAEMCADYDAVKCVVVRVAAVWDQVIPRLRAERARSLELSRVADDLEVDDASLVASSNALPELSEAVLGDPLAFDLAQVEQLGAAFDGIERRLADWHAVVTDWPLHVREARVLLGRAIEATDACDAVVALANSRVALDEPLEPLELPQGIADALERIVRRGGDDRLGRGSELVAWRSGLDERITELESLTRRCRSLIDERDELRARLDAYSAKAARMGLLEQAAVVEAFERARDALYAAPTDLGTAHELVREYQRLVGVGGVSHEL